MIDQAKLKLVSQQIQALLMEDHFTALQTAIIEQKYLSERKKVDIRLLSRRFHKPMRYVKEDVLRAERKLYNLLKEQEGVNQ